VVRFWILHIDYCGFWEYSIGEKEERIEKSLAEPKGRKGKNNCLITLVLLHKKQKNPLYTILAEPRKRKERRGICSFRISMPDVIPLKIKNEHLNIS